MNKWDGCKSTWEWVVNLLLLPDMLEAFDVAINVLFQDQVPSILNSSLTQKYQMKMVSNIVQQTNGEFGSGVKDYIVDFVDPVKSNKDLAKFIQDLYLKAGELSCSKNKTKKSYTSNNASDSTFCGTEEEDKKTEQRIESFTKKSSSKKSTKISKLAFRLVPENFESVKIKTQDEDRIITENNLCLSLPDHLLRWEKHNWNEYNSFLDLDEIKSFYLQNFETKCLSQDFSLYLDNDKIKKTVPECQNLLESVKTEILHFGKKQFLSIFTILENYYYGCNEPKNYITTLFLKSLNFQECIFLWLMTFLFPQHLAGMEILYHYYDAILKNDPQNQPSLKHKTIKKEKKVKNIEVVEKNTPTDNTTIDINNCPTPNNEDSFTTNNHGGPVTNDEDSSVTNNKDKLTSSNDDSARSIEIFKTKFIENYSITKEVFTRIFFLHNPDKANFQETENFTVTPVLNFIENEVGVANGNEVGVANCVESGYEKQPKGGQNGSSTNKFVAGSCDLIRPLLDVAKLDVAKIIDNTRYYKKALATIREYLFGVTWETMYKKNLKGGADRLAVKEIMLDAKDKTAAHALTANKELGGGAKLVLDIISSDSAPSNMESPTKRSPVEKRKKGEVNVDCCGLYFYSSKASDEDVENKLDISTIQQGGGGYNRHFFCIINGVGYWSASQYLLGMLPFCRVAIQPETNITLTLDEKALSLLDRTMTTKEKIAKEEIVKEKIVKEKTFATRKECPPAALTIDYYYNYLRWRIDLELDSILSVFKEQFILYGTTNLSSIIYHTFNQSENEEKNVRLPKGIITNNLLTGYTGIIGGETSIGGENYEKIKLLNISKKYSNPKMFVIYRDKFYGIFNKNAMNIYKEWECFLSQEFEETKKQFKKILFKTGKEKEEIILDEHNLHHFI